MRKSIKRWRGAPRATNPLPIIRGEKCLLENPPTTDSALHRSKRKTGKAGISTLQESGHFYLALTGFEVIHIQKHHRTVLSIACTESESLMQAIHQQAAVGQTGELIVKGESMNFFLSQLAFGDI